MDFRWSTVCVCPSVPTKLATLFLLTYPLLLWALSTRRRVGIGPMTASAIPATLTPLFVAGTAGWLAIASLLHALSMAGGRAVRAAGTAETLAMLTLGGLVAALVCVVSWLRDRMRSKSEPTSFPSATSRLRVFSVALVSLLLLVLASHFAVARRLVEAGETGPIAPTLAFALAGAAGLGACISGIWLILSRRHPAAQFHRLRGAIAALCAAGAILIAALSWHFTTLYRALAMHG